jgi:histidinol-phosphate aminotransferase
MSGITPNQIVQALPDTIPFVAPEELERQLGFKFLARLGANESVFGPSPQAVEAMREQVARSQNYGDPLAFELRVALSSKFGGSLENYLVGPGIDGLLGHLAVAYLDRGSTVITTQGSYPTFEYAVATTGAKVERVPYKNFAVDLEGLAQKADEIQANLVYIANPDNPSGSFHPGEAIKNFLQLLPSSTLIVLDEAYLDFVAPYDIDDERVIRLRTFSKAYGMAGMRVAYAMGNPKLLAPVNKVRAHFEVNSVAQAGALASLRDGEFLNSVVLQNQTNREYLSDLLNRFGLAPLKSFTNFVLADAGTKDRAERIVIQLRNEGVFIRKPAFPPFDSFIRVSIGLDADLDILDVALTKVL